MTAAELIAAGIRPGIISGIKLFADQILNNADSIRNLSIGMRCLPAQTTEFSLSSAFGTLFYSGQTAKFLQFEAVNLQIPSYKIQTENTFAFTKGVYWDGSSNLLIQTCFVEIKAPQVITSHRLRIVATPGRFSCAFNTSNSIFDNCAFSCSVDADGRKQERPYVELMMCGDAPSRYQWQWFNITNTAGFSPSIASNFAGFYQNSFQSAYIVSPAAGSFSFGLRVSDDAGCATDTLFAVAEFSNSTVPPAIPPVVTCQGSFANVSVPGKSATTWFADSSLTQLLGMGTTIQVGPVSGSRTVYALTDTFIRYTGEVNYSNLAPGLPFVLQSIQTLTERFQVLSIMRLDTIHLQIETPGAQRTLQLRTQNGVVLRSISVDAPSVGVFAVPVGILLAAGNYEWVILPGQSNAFELKGLFLSNFSGYSIPNKLKVDNQPVVFFDWKVAFGGGCKQVRPVTITTGNIPPQASFNLTTSGRTIFLQNTSHSATSFIWSFGDTSAVSTQQNPMYTYPQFGSYTVRLIAQGACGVADTITQLIQLIPLGFEDELASTEEFKVFPNPGQDIINIYTPVKATFVLMDVSGKYLKSGEWAAGSQVFDVSDLVQGSYLIKTQMGDSVRVKLWIKY